MPGAAVQPVHGGIKRRQRRAGVVVNDEYRSRADLATGGVDITGKAAHLGQRTGSQEGITRDRALAQPGMYGAIGTSNSQRGRQGVGVGLHMG